MKKYRCLWCVSTINHNIWGFPSRKQYSDCSIRAKWRCKSQYQPVWRGERAYEKPENQLKTGSAARFVLPASKASPLPETDTRCANGAVEVETVWKCGETGGSQAEEGPVRLSFSGSPGCPGTAALRPQCETLELAAGLGRNRTFNIITATPKFVSLFLPSPHRSENSRRGRRCRRRPGLHFYTARGSCHACNLPSQHRVAAARALRSSGQR